jgi:hypothetical protein
MFDNITIISNRASYSETNMKKLKRDFRDFFFIFQKLILLLHIKK